MGWTLFVPPTFGRVRACSPSRLLLSLILHRGRTGLACADSLVFWDTVGSRSSCPPRAPLGSGPRPRGGYLAASLIRPIHHGSHDT